MEDELPPLIPDPVIASLEPLSPVTPSTEAGPEVGSEVVSPKSEKSIEDELLEVELKDTPSMLADLESEVSTMVRDDTLL